MSNQDTPSPENRFEPRDPMSSRAEGVDGGPELAPGTAPEAAPVTPEPTAPASPEPAASLTPEPVEPLLPPPAPNADQAPLPPQVATPPERPAPSPAPEDARPAPEFGEYAPEGWSWDPETGTEGTGGSAAAPGTIGAGATGSAPVSPTLPNVPHNLGVGARPTSGRGRRGPAPAAPSEQPKQPAASGNRPAPYVQQQQTPAPPPGGYAPLAPGQFGPPQQPKRRGDRIATAILLAFGALANFFFAQMFFALESTFAQLYEIYELGEFTAPASVGTLSIVGAISMLSLWALALVGSLLLIRAGKPSWFVPLIAGVLSIVLLFVLLGVAVQAVPELFTAIQEIGVVLPSVAP